MVIKETKELIKDGKEKDGREKDESEEMMDDVLKKLSVEFWTESRSNLLVSLDQRALLIANKAIENSIRYADLTVMDSVLKQQRRGCSFRLCTLKNTSPLSIFEALLIKN